MDKKKATLKTIFSRSKKILETTAKIASKEVGNKAKQQLKKFDEIQKLNSRIEQASLLVKTLGELKGGAMKFGQMLSIDSEDWLPKEVVDVLSKLQKDAPAVKDESMFTFLKSEIGEEGFQKLNIKSPPIAQASIGQVYQGTFNNEKIIIKIQYPGIANTINSDIALIKPLLQSLSTVLGKKIDYSDMFQEIKEVLNKEADYHFEAKCIEQYAKNFQDDDRFIVPSLISNYSTKINIVMGYIDGITLNDWINTNPSYPQKEKVALLLLELFKKEFFEFGLVQTDPNPANFLIQENPIRLVCLDLGASIEYIDEFRQRYKEMIRHVLNQDREKMIETFINSKILDPRENQECLEKFVKMQFHAASPFLSEYQPFDYSSTLFNKELKQNAYDFLKSLKYSSPPKELIFLHRKLGGIFLILKKLKIQMDTSQYFKDIL